MFNRWTTRTSQAGPRLVNWRNPIMRDLFFARVGPDGIHGAGPIGAPQFCSSVVDCDGEALQLDPGGGWHRVSLEEPVTSDQWTLFCFARNASTDGYTTAWGITDAANENRIHQHFRIFDSGRYGADCRPYKSDYNASAYTWPSTDENVATAVVIDGPGNSIKLFANGLLIDSSTLDSTAAITITDLDFFTKNNGSDNAADNSRLSYCLAWQRALMEDEIASLSDNPHQVMP